MRTIAKLRDVRQRRGREIVDETLLAEGRDIPSRDPQMRRDIESKLHQMRFRFTKPELKELLLGQVHTFSPTHRVKILYYTLA